MEASSQSNSQQVLYNDVEGAKEKRTKYRLYQRMALILTFVFLLLGLCIFSLSYLWSPSLGKVYDHEYKAMLDGVETRSLMEIDPIRQIEIFRIGNGSKEVLEVHDFKNGLTGIRFAEHQKCYIRSQTRTLPTAEKVEAEEGNLEVDEMDTKMEDSQVWIPAEEPIVDPVFLFQSRIWEFCQELPIHWIHPSRLSDSELQEEVEHLDSPDTEVKGHRSARDVEYHPPVNDYRGVGLELDNRLDERGYCCQYCHRGYRFCRRYHVPLGGFNPWPYYYRGGHVICQVVMPCNWWIARMLGRI
ncbi:tenomodulin [Corythoichthys intestinalis]|uniref:tenomodulin n=1 Tax=Corythoichthys intestinalis TaxID=161448 RepID=UPI0025A6530D|nr:tenomodulin [Corythoichthys intestinalis]XP_061792563.1 tenomodulin [Nerophis lumbriciformis]